MGRGFYDYGEGVERVEPNKDPRGGAAIYDRILAMLVNEAADAVAHGIAAVEDIDIAVTKGVNYPKGLLAWADERGVSAMYEIMVQLYETYREDRYRPSVLLRKKALSKENFYTS